MTSLLRCLFCGHRHQSFVRNFYGDQIIAYGFHRSEWQCVDCGAFLYRDELREDAA